MTAVVTRSDAGMLAIPDARRVRVCADDDLGAPSGVRLLLTMLQGRRRTAADRSPRAKAPATGEGTERPAAAGAPPSPSPPTHGPATLPSTLWGNACGCAHC